MGEWNRYTTQTKIEELSQLCRQNYRIDPELYTKYDVKRGLRDINGKGVCAGLTNVSQIIPGTEENGETKLGKGQLLFRGYHEALRKSWIFRVKSSTRRLIDLQTRN